MQYLKPKQHYTDLYDLHTIEKCLDIYNSLLKHIKEDRENGTLKKIPEKEFLKETNKCVSYTINILRGERFRHKQDTIDEWMERDKKMQDLYDNTNPPDVTCSKCNSSLTMKLASKTLMNSYEENARMLFMFECLNCEKREAYWPDGEKWNYKRPRCPKCQGELKTKVGKDTKKVMITKTSCQDCSYSETDIDDFEKNEKKRKLEKDKQKQLLEQYREVFCYSEKDGQEYIRTVDGLKEIMEEYKKSRKREADPVFQKVKKLKKLTIVQLEKLLTKALEKEKFIKLSFDKPEMDKFIIVHFTVQSANSKIRDRDCELKLARILKKILENKNWRLMSDGVEYRLGYLSGRLKGYEREEDLYKVMK